MGLASHGYPVFVQACRGTSGSGGVFRPQIDDQRDGIDTLRWVRAQPWFTGRLASAGESYLGYTQWAVAGKLTRDEPETASEALSLTTTMPDFGAITWDNGAYALRNALGWTQAKTVIEQGPFALRVLTGPNPKLVAGFETMPLRDGDVPVLGEHNAWYQDWLTHEDLRDEYWTQQSHRDSVKDVTAPMVMTTGWYDIFLPWQIENYHALAAQGRAPRLTIGPWNHTAPGVIETTLTETLDLFAQVFNGIPHPRALPVHFQLTGTDEWHDAETWPPAGTSDETRYLHADGSLDASAPNSSEAPTAYLYNPSEPTPSTGGPSLNPDMIVNDTDLTGTPVATVWLRSDRPTVDVFVRITDVDPAGGSTSVTDAIRRVGVPGTAHTDPPRTTDGAWPVEIPLWPTGHRFVAGHRLRVQVSSGAFPRYARNTGSGKPAADDVESHLAHQEILHEPGRASSIRLPVWHS
jgi:putative CocE/NonD family hydrolase